MRPGADSFAAEQKRVATLWRRAKEAGQVGGEADEASIAAATQQVAQDHLRHSTLDRDGLSKLEALGARTWATRSLRKRMAARSATLLTGHKSWRGGLALATYSDAVAPEKMSSVMMKEAQAEAVIEKAMGFNPIASENPKPLPRSAEVCSAKFGGLCQDDPGAET